MNPNCLKGVMCPKCGQTERFDIAAHCLVTVTDDGTDNEREFEWDGNDTIWCCLCDHTATFADFRHPGFYVTFDTVTPESAEAGDTHRSGWWEPGEWLLDDKPDTPAFVFDPEDYDEEEHDDLDEAIVEWAVGVLESEGAIHPSSHPANDADWWSTESEVMDYATGEEITKSFHFHNLRGDLVERINFRMMEG